MQALVEKASSFDSLLKKLIERHLSKWPIAAMPVFGISQLTKKTSTMAVTACMRSIEYHLCQLQLAQPCDVASLFEFLECFPMQAAANGLFSAHALAGGELEKLSTLTNGIMTVYNDTAGNEVLEDVYEIEDRFHLLYPSLSRNTEGKPDGGFYTNERLKSKQQKNAMHADAVTRLQQATQDREAIAAATRARDAESKQSPSPAAAAKPAAAANPAANGKTDPTISKKPQQDKK